MAQAVRACFALGCVMMVATLTLHAYLPETVQEGLGLDAHRSLAAADWIREADKGGGGDDAHGPVMPGMIGGKCEGKDNIFRDGHHLHAMKITSYIIGVIVMSLVIELGFHALEHALDKTSKKLVEKCQKELGLLGILSFGLFLITTFASSCVPDFEDNKHHYEFAHVLVFFMALFYILQSSMLIISVRRLRTKFVGLEHKHVKDTKGYLQFRQSFIQKHELPQNFSFDKYLSYNYKDFVTEALEIKPRTWTLLIVLLALDIVLEQWGKGATAYYLTGRVIFAAFGLALLLIDCGLLFWLKRQHDQILAKLPKVNPAASIQDRLERQGAGGAHEGGSALEVSMLRDTFRDGVHDDAAEDTSSDEEDNTASAGHSAGAHHQHHHHHNMGYRLFKAFLKFFGLGHDHMFLAFVETMWLVNCLYLSSYVSSYVYQVFHANHFATWLKVVLLLLPLLPSLLSIVYLKPLILADYMLVNTTKEIDLHVYDEVVEHMYSVEHLFERVHEVFVKTGEMDPKYLYKTFDKAGNGRVTLFDLKKGLRKRGLRLSEKDLKKVGHLIGKDSRGYLNRRSFERLLLGRDIYHAPAVEDAQASMLNVIDEENKSTTQQ
jgi:hypothetical protein